MTCEPEDPPVFPPPESGLPPPPQADSASTEVTARAETIVRFFMMVSPDVMIGAGRHLGDGRLEDGRGDW